MNYFTYITPTLYPINSGAARRVTRPTGVAVAGPAAARSRSKMSRSGGRQHRATRDAASLRQRRPLWSQVAPEPCISEHALARGARSTRQGRAQASVFRFALGPLAPPHAWPRQPRNIEAHNALHAAVGSCEGSGRTARAVVSVDGVSYCLWRRCTLPSL